MIRFVLPGEKTRVIVARVAVCWATEPLFGMQFVEMSKENRSAYDDWLKSMALI